MSGTDGHRITFTVQDDAHEFAARGMMRELLEELLEVAKNFDVDWRRSEGALAAGRKSDKSLPIVED